jgi:cell wall-associated NlpC family hydrolase
MASARKATAVLGALLGAIALAACGQAAPRGARTRADPPAGHAAHTRPAAQAGSLGDALATSTKPDARPPVAREVADPLEAESYPAPASVKHASAATPAQAGETVVAAGAASDAEIRSELQQTQAAERKAQHTQQRTFTAVPGGESIGGDGTIPIPSGVPEVVQKVIAGANEIADFPYVYGGGHDLSFIDDAYDCSGSVSYALAAGGLLGAPETSGELEHWGVPGPGRYITVYANAGHTYMYVDGILYDTAGRSGVFASRWQVAPTDNAGYVARHWPGL